MTKEEMFEERRKVCRKLCEEIQANDHIKENTPLYKLTLPKGTTYVMYRAASTLTSMTFMRLQIRKLFSPVAAT